jgi:hypothetical protein
MRFGPLRQAFDRRDRASSRLLRQHVATLDRHAIEQHGAGAALRGVAAGVGAGQAERAAQHVDQQRSGLGFKARGTAVDVQAQGGHGKGTRG